MMLIAPLCQLDSTRNGAILNRQHRSNAGLDKNPGNFASLSPLSFMARAAEVYPERAAIIYGDRKTSWSEAYQRCRRLASALVRKGVGEGDTVAVMAPNIPAIFEAHYGIPMSGAVINALNTRLDARAVAFMLEHGEASVLIADTEYSATVSAALAMLEHPPLVIDIDDPLGPGGERLGDIEYETFLESGSANFDWQLPSDEWNAIALSYTSGTTGIPKGVVTHHRGAYLNAVGNIVTWSMPHFPVYLWTLPMFHCNGWTYTWAVTAMAGTHICLRRVEAARIFRGLLPIYDRIAGEAHPR